LDYQAAYLADITPERKLVININYEQIKQAAFKDELEKIAALKIPKQLPKKIKKTITEQVYKSVISRSSKGGKIDHRKALERFLDMQKD